LKLWHGGCIIATKDVSHSQDVMHLATVLQRVEQVRHRDGVSCIAAILDKALSFAWSGSAFVTATQEHHCKFQASCCVKLGVIAEDLAKGLLRNLNVAHLDGTDGQPSIDLRPRHVKQVCLCQVFGSLLETRLPLLYLLRVGGLVLRRWLLTTEQAALST
jgi:hypothetical protein